MTHGGDAPNVVPAHTTGKWYIRSRTLALLVGAMFDVAFRRFAAAFERRADEVYGRNFA